MDLLDKIIVNNQSLLDELKNVLIIIDRTNSSLYAKPELVAGNASIGGHCRHIIDFYLAFFKGLKDQKIDYDQRERNKQVENNIGKAISKLELMSSNLQQVNQAPDLKLSVSVSTDPAISIMHGQSTLVRELQFIHSHSTHHMAIISIILRINGIMPDENFGKAPSTVAFEQKRACVQ